MSELKKIGAVLRDRRAARGLTVREAATEVGLSYSMLAQIERGQNTTIKRVEELCAFYGLRFTTAIEPADVPTSLVDLSALSPEGREIVVRLAEVMPTLTADQLSALTNVLALVRRHGSEQE